jgi:putative oxidoreductase
MNAGLLLLHGFLGAALVAHAFQKLLVFKYTGVVAYVDSLGFRAPRLMAVLVIANELVGGALVALGVLLPLGAALVAATMLVASRTDHRGKGWFITGSGSELVITNAVAAIALVATGAGRYAVGPQLHGLGWAAAAAGAALIGAAGALSLRRYASEPLLSGA